MDTKGIFSEAYRVAHRAKSLDQIGWIINREGNVSDLTNGVLDELDPHIWRHLLEQNPVDREQLLEKLDSKGVTVSGQGEEEPFNIERFIQLREAATNEWNKFLPKNKKIEVKIETSDPILLCFLSDLHIGSKGVNHQKIKEDLSRIRDHSHTYCSVGGDLVNNYIIRGLMSVGLDDTFVAGGQQFVIASHLLSIVAENHSLIYVGSGNHDGWTEKIAMVDPRFHMFSKVPYIYTGQGALIDLWVGQQKYVIYRRHRPRWSSVFNLIHAVVAEYQRNPYNFDIGVLEHTHESIIAPFYGKERKDKSLSADMQLGVRYGVRPGTAKLSDSYADERGFFYSSDIIQSLILYPDTMEMFPVSGLDRALRQIDLINGL